MPGKVIEKVGSKAATKATEKTNPLWKAWLWAVGRFAIVWVGFTGVFASFSVCPFCGAPGCPTGAGFYGTAIAIIYTVLRIKRRNPVNPKDDQHNHN